MVHALFSMPGAQVSAAALALVIAALAPPERGDFLVVPLTASARARLLPLALAHGATLTGRGPLPGSFVVRGSRAALGTTLAVGLVTLAAPATECGRGRSFQSRGIDAER